MLFIYRLIFGYLRVKFYGDYRERILSLCATNGINLWNTKTSGDAIISSVLLRDFRHIRHIAAGQKIRVHILKKSGLPFVTQRYKRRFGILAGAVLFFCILEFMSGYIWIIDINGNHNVKDEEILAACEKIGITEGIKKDSIYPKFEREKLLLELDDIAWASLNIEGSRLTVNVTEIREYDREKVYSNLKSTADGIIEKMDIVSGNSVVKVGDAVKKGDLLVSGIIETADSTRFVNSRGTVTARTERKIVLKEDYLQKMPVPTGEVKSKSVLDFYGFEIPLYLGRETENYEYSQKSRQLKLFGQSLPIFIHTKRFEFYKEKNVKYDYEQLCDNLTERLEEEISGIECESSRVISKEFSDDGTGVTLTAVVELEENIVFEDILLIDAGN